jgi:hypothetical protein
VANDRSLYACPEDEQGRVRPAFELFCFRRLAIQEPPRECAMWKRREIEKDLTSFDSMRELRIGLPLFQLNGIVVPFF